MKTRTIIIISVLFLLGLSIFMWVITPVPDAYFINFENPISENDIGSMIKSINSRG